LETAVVNQVVLDSTGCGGLGAVRGVALTRATCLAAVA
jgi:hypothetical protein